MPSIHVSASKSFHHTLIFLHLNLLTISTVEPRFSRCRCRRRRILWRRVKDRTPDPYFLQPAPRRPIPGRASPFPTIRFSMDIFCPGSVSLDPMLLMRIHEDKSPRKQGVLPSIL